MVAPLLQSRVLAVLLLGVFALGACDGSEPSGSEDDVEAAEANLGEPQPTTTTTFDDLATLDGDALRSALLGRIQGHRSLGYNRARKTMFARDAKGFQTDAGKLECVYTGRLVDPTGSTAVGGFNTEHSWPQSMGAGSEPMKSDLHHLFPVDNHANSVRGNLPFGEPTCAQPSTSAGHCSFGEGGSFMGRDASGHNTFEVRPEKRGDIARAHFYFAVRYGLHIPSYEEAVLRAWSDEDPVDALEQKRNATIAGIQNNRNPFVDRPDFVAKITDY